MTVLALAALNDTVTVTLPPPSPTVSSPTLNSGGSSSSVIVTVASPSSMVALDSPLSVNLNVSSSSSVVSSLIVTETVLDMSPAANDSIPDAVV